MGEVYWLRGSPDSGVVTLMTNNAATRIPKARTMITMLPSVGAAGYLEEHYNDRTPAAGTSLPPRAYLCSSVNSSGMSSGTGLVTLISSITATTKPIAVAVITLTS